MSHLCKTCGQDVRNAPNRVSEENLAAIIGGIGIVLEEQEAIVLNLLVRHSPNAVPYERMISALYPDPDDEPEDAKGVLDQRLWSLTHKLEPAAVKIEVLHGLGRRLVAK